jgi:hypothetical protein
MRRVALAILALSVAAPALAAPSRAQRDLEKASDMLGNPVTQNAMAGAMGAMLGALLDMRVDGIAKALEPLNGGRKLHLKGNTVRDIAMRDDPHFEDKMEDGTKAMVGGLGALAGALAQAMPQLEDAMAKAGDAMDRVKARDEYPD